MDYQGGWAYTAPSAITPELTKAVYGDPMQEYRKQQAEIQRQKLADTEAQRKLENQSRATKYADNATRDISQYGTGDPVTDLNINDQLHGLHQDIVKQISDNPNMNDTDIDNYITPRIKEISDRAVAVKTARAQMEKQIELMQKEKGYNTEGLLQAGVNRMIYDKDPVTGKQTLRRKIDPSHDYIGDEQHDNASKWFNDDAISEELKRQEENASDISSHEATDHAGVKISSGVKGSVLPFQSVIRDPKTNKIVGIKNNSVNATDPDTGKPIIDPTTKQPMQIVDDETLAKFNKPAILGALKGDVDKTLLAANIDPTTVDTTSPKYQMFVKHALLMKLEATAKKKFEPIEKTDESAWREKMQYGGMNAAGNETKTEKKEEDKLKGSKFGTMIRAANQDPAIVNSGVPYTDPNTGDNYIDVTSTVSHEGFKTDADKPLTAKTAGFQKVTNLLVKPGEKGVIYTVEHNVGDPAGDPGTIHRNTKKDIESMMYRHGSANGVGTGDVDKLKKLIPIQEESPSESRERIWNELQAAKNKPNIIPPRAFDVQSR